MTTAAAAAAAAAAATAAAGRTAVLRARGAGVNTRLGAARTLATSAAVHRAPAGRHGTTRPVTGVAAASALLRPPPVAVPAPTAVAGVLRSLASAASPPAPPTSSSSDAGERADHDHGNGTGNEGEGVSSVGGLGRISGLPHEHLRRRMRIYRPARTAMQQGRGSKTQLWRAEFETSDGYGRWTNPLMGWTSSGDPLSQTLMTFSSRDAAVQYAERNGFEYAVYEPQQEHMHERKIAPYGRAMVHHWAHDGVPEYASWDADREENEEEEEEEGGKAEENDEVADDSRQHGVRESRGDRAAAAAAKPTAAGAPGSAQTARTAQAAALAAAAPAGAEMQAVAGDDTSLQTAAEATTASAAAGSAAEDGRGTQLRRRATPSPKKQARSDAHASAGVANGDAKMGAANAGGAGGKRRTRGASGAKRPRTPSR